jgi:hypothetical protein
MLFSKGPLVLGGAMTRGGRRSRVRWKFDFYASEVLKWAEPDNFADLVILNYNPTDDIARASDIESVIKNGVLYSANTLLTAPSP